MANEVANLVVEISADAKKLNQELKLSEQNIQAFSTKATTNFKLIGAAVGGAVIGGLTLLANRLLTTAKALDDLGDSAQSIGLTTKELQRLQFQAGQAGSDADGLTQSFIFMQNAVVDAARGSQQQVEAFQKLGINIQILKQLKPEQQFEMIANAFNKISDSQDQIDISRTIFGRAGVGQINLLNSKLKESKELFDRLGLGLSEQQAQNVDSLDKSSKLLDTIFDDFGNKIAADVSPAFDAINKGINQTIEEFGGLGGAAEFISKAIVTSFSAIADGAVVLYKPFKALGTLWEGVKLAGTNLGVTAAQLVHGSEMGSAAFRGEIPLPLPGDQSSKDEQSIANDVKDAQAKKLRDSIENFDTVDKNSKTEVLLNNIANAFKTSGNEADAAKKKVDQFKGSLDAAGNAAAGVVGKTTVLDKSLKKTGATFDEEETAFLNKIKSFSDPAKQKTDQQLQDSIVGKLSALNTSDSSAAILDLFKAVGNKNNSERGINGTGKGFGTISDENGNIMSVGSPQNIVVTVVLVPDEGRLFNAVVDSQIFQRAVVDTSNKNLMNVTRSDRS